MSEVVKWIANFFRGFRCWVVVMPWERAVRARLGKWLKLLQPGPHLRIPLLDEVKIFNSRLRIASFPQSTVTTRDGKTVTASGLVAFHIVDPLRAIMKLKEPDSVCASLAMSYTASYITARKLTAIDISVLENEAAYAVEKGVPGLRVDWVRLIEFANVRTFRLLQDQWKPGTHPETH